MRLMLLRFGIAVVLSAALVAASFTFAGRYHVTTIRSGQTSYVMMVDRFTGAASYCIAAECRDIPKVSGQKDGGPDDWITPPK